MKRFPTAPVMRTVFGLLVSGGAVLVLARSVDSRQMLTAFSRVEWDSLLLPQLLMASAWVIFSIRFNRMISSAARLSVRSSFALLSLAHLSNTILPLRLGDVTRVAAMARRYSLGVVFTTAAVLLEKALDVLVLVIVAWGLSWVVQIPENVRTGLLAAGGICLVVFAILLFLAEVPRCMALVVVPLRSTLPENLAARIISLVESIAGSIRVIRTPGQFAELSALSFAGWLLAALNVFFISRACGAAIPFTGALFALVVIHLGNAVPAGPANIGVYEYLAVVGLSPWIPDRSAALAVGAVLHACDLSLLLLCGAVSAAILRADTQPERDD